MSLYLERYAWPNVEFPDYKPSKELELIVVIPSFDEGDISRSLKSLDQCSDKENVLIIVIVNESEYEEESVSIRNKKTIQCLNDENFELPIVHKLIKLPEKKAGVGLARKIGMDEAVRIFESLKKDGIILCFDADCICETNYFNEIKKFFNNKSNNLGLVHYEHDLTGENIDAIINYELFLRYYVNALRWADFPFALQTLGSCIAVKSVAYQKQGGMNTRKAGEDFYFIHKMIPLGGIGEINSTSISPSDRISDRVPFGTGHAIQKYIDQTEAGYETYNPRIFSELKQFLSTIPFLFESSDNQPNGCSYPCVDFLNQHGFESALEKMKKQSPNIEVFRNRFFSWFDAFRVLKFVHFMRDHYYPNIDIVDAIGWVNHQYLKIKGFDGSKEVKLMDFRAADKTATFYIK